MDVLRFRVRKRDSEVNSAAIGMATGEQYTDKAVTFRAGFRLVIQITSIFHDLRWAKGIFESIGS